MRYFIVFALYEQTDRDLSYGFFTRHKLIYCDSLPTFRYLSEQMEHASHFKFIGVTGFIEITEQEFSVQSP